MPSVNNKRKGTRTTKPATKRVWRDQPLISPWPPCNDEKGEWKREIDLRKAPGLVRLVYHHPDNLVEIIQRLIALDHGAAAEVRKILVSQLPIGITPEDVAAFTPNPKEIPYVSRLIVDVADLARCYPFDLWKIVVLLVNNDNLPKITGNAVRGITMNITQRHSQTRKKIRYARLAREQLENP